MDVDSKPKQKSSEISKEALSVLKETVQQIKNLNADFNKKYDAKLLSMSSKEIAQALTHKINPAQFSNPSEQNE